LKIIRRGSRVDVDTHITVSESQQCEFLGQFALANNKVWAREGQRQ